MAAGRFEILEIPGAGAHAAVCLAIDRTTGGRVCLKVLRTAFDPTSSEAKRVRDEARLLRRLDHPGIVKLIDALELEGRQVLVMECVDGPPVARLVRRLGHLPWGVALEIARHVASAVDYAYRLPGDEGRALRLVHRDLNLSNVLISIDGVVRVLDYGMARADFDEREADTHVGLLGTQGFTAPEGLVRIADNPKLDVYSLGVCTFLMLTGHLPILSKQRVAHAASLAEQLAWARERLAAGGADPGPIDALLRSMCAFQPDDRPSMAEVAQTLSTLVPADVDLAGFAREHVVPLHEGRKRTPAAEHEAWAELQFLGEPTVQPAPVPSAPGPSVAGPSARSPEVQLADLLSMPGWHSRPDDLRDCLASGADPLPAIALLRRFAAPWWQVFSRRPRVDGALVLLDVLADRPTDELRAVCHRLVLHRDARVAERARAITARPRADVARGAV